MRPVHRAALLVAPAALALSSCGIPATDVVEAGGPASGIAPTTPVYFVRNGTLVAVPRRVPEAGDVRTALEALLQGPTAQERLKSLTTRLARQPERLWPTSAPARTQDGTTTPADTPPPSETPTEAAETPTEAAETPTEAAETATEAAETPTEAVEVTTRGDSLSVELPWYTAELSSLAADQVICTAARAYLPTLWDVESVTVTVTSAVGRTAEGSDDRCPDL
ncbi:hypothetical protein [Streptomyces aurantiogriseus]|uniref:GerMN domain-containing protein n=1 Tax=Streptomyces aurantiogriseus TaxID=66870 RepID=A0A918CLP9_9ACTN|nr:hypothetical protein [Streptomyces aurantiogriseus]GGR27874.1 hypothetical protein GCM10010251_49880 [Streptomyces aurantiogriseus]